MSEMDTVTIYGASDDLIEVEGAVGDEFNAYSSDEDTKHYLSFSDGTLLRVVYDDEGMWRITPMVHGSAEYSKKEAMSPEDDYSDRVTLTASAGSFKWVAYGRECDVRRLNGNKR